MTGIVSLIVLAGISFAGSVTLAAQDSDQQPSAAVMQAVNAAFPQGLRYKGAPPSGEGEPVDPYDTCAAVFNRNADGTPDLIAAAYSGHKLGAEIAMLAYQPGAAQIVDAVKTNYPLVYSSTNQLDFAGGPCEALIVNLADPAQPGSLLARTVLISFEGQDWFFLWGGNKLRNITALMPGSTGPHHDMPPDSYIHTVNIVDVDHRGAMQLVGNNGDMDKFPQDDGIASSGTSLLFRYNGTTYALTKTVLLLDECGPPPPNYKTASNGPWQGNRDVINMHGTPAPSYQLNIVNGDRDGSNRVTSAKVVINGVTVVSPNEVNSNVETLTRAILLQQENSITVMADGPVNSHMYLMIE